MRWNVPSGPLVVSRSPFDFAQGKFLRWNELRHLPVPELSAWTQPFTA